MATYTQFFKSKPSRQAEVHAAAAQLLARVTQHLQATQGCPDSEHRHSVACLRSFLLLPGRSNTETVCHDAKAEQVCTGQADVDACDSPPHPTDGSWRLCVCILSLAASLTISCIIHTLGENPLASVSLWQEGLANDSKSGSLLGHQYIV
eukprot:5618487-Amphidinium_carterae.1